MSIHSLEVVILILHLRLFSDTANLKNVLGELRCEELEQPAIFASIT